jgi:macrolide-specific efflux system membrane fusion protein
VSVLIDETDLEIYTNMAVTATIITSFNDESILLSSGAILLVDGNSIVKILKNNEISEVKVEIGDSNDIQTEVISGVNEGDVVVVGSIIKTQTTSKPSTSVFGGSTSKMGGGMRM